MHEVIDGFRGPWAAWVGNGTFFSALPNYDARNVAVGFTAAGGYFNFFFQRVPKNRATLRNERSLPYSNAAPILDANSTRSQFPIPMGGALANLSISPEG